MNIDRIRRLGAGATLLVALPLLAGCEHDMAGRPVSTYGEANRQTMMAQVIDPEPEYDAPLATSAEHAGQAIERYRTDKVKKPERVTSTQTSGGGR
ncbi:MAG TPA: hypothetical protein VJM34_06985 [Novosphingobium sp.]|nr:hypothetical protein [Novosphingobium sp.]